MKILKLDLRAFGPFTNVALDLSGGNEGLHVIFGPNEAGKSSALRAVKHMLYGIPARTDDGFVHAYDALRIGATLRRQDGSELTFLRRKGNRRTLLGADGESPLDDASLEAFLGAVGAEQFGTLFGIDQQALALGGKATLDTGGHIGQLLFGAGLDLTRLRQFQKRLDEQIGLLFKPSGTNPELNKAFADFVATRKAIDEASIRGSDWIEHDTALRSARERKGQIEQELEVAFREKGRLERFQQAVDDLAARRQLAAELETLADVNVLRAEFGDERRNTQTAFHHAQEIEAEALRKSEELRAVLADLHVPETLLEYAEAIDGVQRGLGSFQRSSPNLIKLRAEYEQLAGNIRTLLRRLALPDNPGEVGIPRLKPTERALVEKLIAEGAAVAASRDGCARELVTSTEEECAAREELADLETTRDADQLRTLVQRLTRLGDLDAQAGIARAELAKSEKHLALDLRKLPLWSGNLDELEALAVPAVETVDRFEAELGELERTVEQRQAGLKKAESDCRSLQHQLEQARLEHAVPSEEDLASARARRDRGWTLIKGRLRGDEPDESLRRAFLAGDTDLADAYERSVQQADEASDRLRREAQRVALMARLRTDVQSAAAQVEALQTDLGDAESRLRDAQARWFEVWSAIGIQPLTPREMRAWLNSQTQLVTKARALHDNRDRIAALEQTILSARSELSDALAALGEAPLAPTEPLGDAISRAQAFADRARENAAARSELEKRCAKARKHLDDVRRRAVAAEQAVADWKAAWGKALAPLGLEADATAEAARAVIDDLRELDLLLGKRDGHGQQIESAEREAERYRTAVRELASCVAPDLADRPTEDVAMQMNARLVAAREARTRREQTLKRLEEQQERASEARVRIETNARRLAELCQEAGCQGPAELASVEERSALKRNRQAELDAVEARLRRLAGSNSLEGFIADAATVDSDVLPLRVAQICEQIRNLDATKQEIDQAIGREEQVLHSLGARAKEAKALDEAAQKQHLRARIESGVERFLRLKVASTVLREAIERYREKNQAPVLTRAGAIFAKLTCGSFEGLRTDLNDRDEPVLVGVRAGSRQQVGVDGMSDGTNDQLFLALKLALLEHYLEDNPPLPFIVDDVLIQFDDSRAVAALQVLAELSTRTQVLFFTHHQHLIDLARAHLEPAVLFLHQLPGRKGHAA